MLNLNALTDSTRNMSIYSLLQARETEQRPIRVGIVGAGATGRAIALQLGTPPSGMRLAAIANRTIANGERALREAGIDEWSRASSAKDVEKVISAGRTALTEDPKALIECDAVDILVEVTGT